MIDAVETQIGIGAPIERVWQILTDYQRYAHWNPFYVRVTGEARTGADIRVTSRWAGRDEPLVQTVTVGQCAPFQMEWHSGADDRTAFAQHHSFTLDQQGAETILRNGAHFTGTIAANILATHRDPLIAHLEKMNAALKACAEGCA